MKRNLIIITLLVIIIIVFNIFYNTKNSYRYEYKVGNIKVIESYKKPQDYFTFELKHEDDLIVFNINDGYSYKRGLIKELEFYNDENKLCVNIKGLIDFYPICKTNKTYLFAYEKVEDQIEPFVSEGYSIYEKNNNFFLWNYRGFNFVHQGEVKNLNFLKTDEYNPSLIKQVNNFLFVPNYDEDFFFKTFYLVDINTGNVTKRDLNHEISFDIEYMKHEKNKLYVYDKLNEVEYTIYLRSGKSEINKGITYSNKELSSLLSEQKFFYVNNNGLEYKIGARYVNILSEKDIKIIKSNEEEVQYLISDTLYSFNIYKGFKTLIKNNEWLYNYENLIYSFE